MMLLEFCGFLQIEKQADMIYMSACFLVFKL